MFLCFYGAANEYVSHKLIMFTICCLRLSEITRWKKEQETIWRNLRRNRRKPSPLHETT